MRALRSHRVIAGFIASTVMGFAAASPAAYMQLTQDRLLTAQATASGPGTPAVTDPKTETSTALGSFDRSLSSSARVQRINFPNEFAQASATASQAVTFGPESIDGQFQIGGFTGQLAAGETAGSSAENQWSTRFSVDKATPFHLTGEGSVQLGGLGSVGTSSVTFAFNGDGPGENFVGTGGIGGTGPIDASGVLQPGHVYTLIARINASKGGGLGDDFQKDYNGNLHFALAVPEPGGAVGLLGFLLLGLRRGRTKSL